MTKSNELRILIHVNPDEARSRIEAAFRQAGALGGACLILNVTEERLNSYCRQLRVRAVATRAAESGHCVAGTKRRTR